MTTSINAQATDFHAALNAISPETVTAGLATITKAYDDRAELERAKNADNDKIHVSLGASKKTLATEMSVAILLAAGAAPDFICQGTREGSAYNVYAANKLADLVKALEAGFIKNAVNNAITRSLFAFRAAGETFTGELAKACVSDKIRIQGEIKKLLVRHTASQTTASTQASSTLQALMTLGIVEKTGTRSAQTYRLTDTPQTAQLEEALKKAA